jgi:hypothetical protein
METQPLTLEPQHYEFRSAYLRIDPATVKTSIEDVIARSGDYFSKPLDGAWIEVISEAGAHKRWVSVREVSNAFDLVTDETAQLKLFLCVERRTPNLRIRDLSDEYINFAIDFGRRSVFAGISILGLRKAKEIQEVLSDGIELINLDLPTQHQYLEPYLRSFLSDHPSTEHNVFLIMRFKDEAPFPKIVEAVKSTCAERGLAVVRADDKEYTDDLWDNVLTYLYGCDYAIAIFDQINYREFNPNVALEVGFLFAQMQARPFTQGCLYSRNARRYCWQDISHF